MSYFSSPNLNDYREQTELALKQMRSVWFPDKIHDRVLLGFDGYLDHISSVIKVRRSPFEYELMEKISTFAARIAHAAGSSASIELLTKRQSAGGFTSNLGKGLSTLCGLQGNIHLIGTFGVPKIAPVFQSHLVNTYKCHLYPVGNPGMVEIYEFSDGKIMMVNSESINHLTWSQILSHYDLGFYIDQFSKSRLLGIGYWAAIPHMSEIFRAIQKTILPSIPIERTKKHLLIDCSDLQKKPQSQLNELGQLLSKFEEFIPVVLLLNDHELKDFGEAIIGTSQFSALELTSALQEKLNLSYVISHGPKVATIATASIQTAVLNAFTSSAKFTTSAGDHFNAGVGYALLTGAPAMTLPLFGNCASSFFVRKGSSPTSLDIQRFLSHYLNYLEIDSDSILN